MDLFVIILIFSFSTLCWGEEVIQVNDSAALEKQFNLNNLDKLGLIDEYRLSKYDVVNICIIGLPEGIGGITDVQIRPDGYVSLPYAGNVKLAGLTLPEATELLTDRLKSYIKIPDMTLSIKSYGPRKVYVLGSVNSPGVKSLSVDSMDVFSALSSAGGIDKRGRTRKIQIIRNIDNQLYVKEIDMNAYIKNHDITQNVKLADGDMVYVPKSKKIIFNQDILPYISLYGMIDNLTD
ncbi:MAG: polysaccharide biosynthesis/export family protein [bacterium]